MFAKRNERTEDAYNAHTKALPPLEVGSKVWIQEKTGKHHWLKTGRVVEKLDFRQYRVKMDHSGRVSLQNRRFLKPCYNMQQTPVIIPSPCVDDDDEYAALPDSNVSNDDSSDTAVPEQYVTEPEEADIVQPLVMRKLPRALKNLQDFNLPGRKEHDNGDASARGR